MTSLRQRMIEDMQIRNLSVKTQDSYIKQVSLFARHFNKSPELLGPEQIRVYQVYLTNEKRLATNSILIAIAALRFLYKVTLNHLTESLTAKLGNIVPGTFTPVLAKHTKHLSLVDILSVAVDRMQRNFEPMRRQVEAWRTSQLSDEAAKLIIYRAFIAGELEVPKHLAPVVHNHYFDPRHEEFAPRIMWSLSNAFTSAFKELEAIPQFRATAKLGAFLEGIHAA